MSTSSRRDDLLEGYSGSIQLLKLPRNRGALESQESWRSTGARRLRGFPGRGRLLDTLGVGGL